MSRSLNDLHPKVRKLAEKLILRAMENGTPIIITQTYRTKEEQDALYAQGRTAPGRVVTNARGGESYHNYGLAFDVAIIGRDGKVRWENDADVNANGVSDWEEVGRIGEELGLEWGGRWQEKKRDAPHFQYTFGLSIQDLKNGRRPPYG
jgi:peptidoglycan L-alanyl-D-glutamate endopeptidase CwlK